MQILAPRILVRRFAHLNSVMLLALMMLVVVPVTVLACRGFYQLFDRPFMKPAAPFQAATAVNAAGAENIRLAA
jgi:peptidoglycan/LPS O-acetylase OafA/YrhL